MMRSFEPRPRAHLRRIALAGYWIILIGLFIGLRAHSADVLLTVDETIPLEVSQAMSARGALDPNWRFADLPDYLRYDQYNFYFYNVVAHVVLGAAKGSGVSPLSVLRLANTVFQLLALAFVVGAMRRLSVGRFGPAFAAALIAFAPGMVQDAGMARPESLLYLLTGLLIWVLSLPLAERRRMLVAGLVLGAGVAVKLTFLSLAAIMVVPLALSWRDRGIRAIAASTATAALGALIGFAAAAPYTVLHPDVYIHGIAKLAAQYRSEHAPHTTQGVAAQAWWIGRYFLELYGLVPLVALAAPLLLKGTTRAWAIGFVAAWLVLVLYFATSTVSFERNFAHGLVPLLLAAALSIAAVERTPLRMAGAVLMLLPMVYWSIQIAAAMRARDGAEQFEMARGLSPTRRIFFDTIYRREIPSQCATVAVLDFNDPWSASYLEKLAQNGFVPIARYHSRFSPLVTSTLHAYLDRDVHYLRCP